VADSGTDAYRRAVARIFDSGDAATVARDDGLRAGERRALRVAETIRRAHADSPEPAGVAVGDDEALVTGYEVLEVFARGSLTILYRARDRALGREVALKVFPFDAASRAGILAEARALAAIDHPNVVRIYAIDEDDEGRLRLALELVRGRTLDRMVREGGPLDARLAARAGAAIARGLAAVHARGLVHRDVKPVNVVREDGTGRIVLVDFGLVLDVARGPREGAGPFAGTPLFMAPEQMEGAVSTGPAADQFALGVLLHYVVSGEFPFAASTFEDLRAVIRSRRAPRPLATARPLQAIVARLLAPEPSERYASIADAELALAAFGGDAR